LIRHLTAAISAALLATSPAAAQAPARVTRSNANAWLMYFGDHRLSSALGAHLEAQLRRADVVTDPQQLLLRAGLNHYAAPGAMLSGGYAYVLTSPYGKFPSPVAFPEHRAWQQLQLAHTAGPLAWQHRFRLEQRWVGQMAQAGGGDPRVEVWRYTNRFRALTRGTLPLRGRTLEPRELYLTAYDELFVNFGRQVQLNVFDQNRAYAALGYRAGSAVRVELGYLNQRVFRANGREVENNHTLQAALYSTAPFARAR
jgi:hypothetical protein